MPENNDPDNLLAIIGDEDRVLGFRALGFTVYPVEDRGGCIRALEAVAHKKAAICLVQDTFYRMAEEEIDGYRKMPLSIFIPFGATERTSLLDEMVRGIRLKATGAF